MLYKRDGGLLCEEPVKRALDWETEMVVCYTKNQSRERWTGKQRWWFVIPRTSQESAGLGNRDGGLLYQVMDWETRTSQESAGRGNRDGGLLYQEPVKRALDWETEMVVCYTKNQSRERWTGKQRWWFVMRRTSGALDWETEMVVCYTKNQSRERWTGKQRWWFVMRRTSQESAGLGNRDGGLLCEEPVKRALDWLYQEPVKRALDWETEMVVCYGGLLRTSQESAGLGNRDGISQESAGLGNRDGGLLYQEPVKRALDWETEMVVCYASQESAGRETEMVVCYGGLLRTSQESAGLGNRDVIPRTSQESAGLGNRDGGLLYQEPVKRALDWETEMVKRALDWETEMVVCYTKNQSRERWTGKQRCYAKNQSRERWTGKQLYQEPVKRALDWETEMVVCYAKNQSRER